jgi:Flp pilus assembly protein TadG
MLLLRKPPRGVSVVEFAIIAPTTFIILLGLLIFGMGIFRYQQVAAVSREASRYASVHGALYAKTTGNPAATATDVYNNVIVPQAASLNLNNLTYSVTWNSDNGPYHSGVLNGTVTQVRNTVTVTVTYVWKPEALFSSGITMTCTSTSIMWF